MYRLAILFCTVYTVLANPIVVKEQDASTKYFTAFDTRFELIDTAMKCLANSGYSLGFIRLNVPLTGQFAPVSANSIANAQAAGIPCEGYVDMSFFVNATSSFKDIYAGLTAKNIKIKFLWLKVANKLTWSSSEVQNVNAVNEFKRAALAKGIAVGIMTNADDWNIITNYNATFSKTPLWYTHTIASGVLGETPKNFDDFNSFGNWTTPEVKTFAVAEKICGHNLNRIVYKGDSATLNIAKTNEELTIGGNFH